MCLPLVQVNLRLQAIDALIPLRDGVEFEVVVSLGIIQREKEKKSMLAHDAFRMGKIKRKPWTQNAEQIKNDMTHRNNKHGHDPSWHHNERISFFRRTRLCAWVRLRRQRRELINAVHRGAEVYTSWFVVRVGWRVVFGEHCKCCVGGDCLEEGTFES